MKFSNSYRRLIDWTCFLFVLLLMQQRKGWKFDEIEGISSST